jgi:hypothetical protein
LTDKELVLRKLAFLSEHWDRAHRRRQGTLGAVKIVSQEAVDIASPQSLLLELRQTLRQRQR